MAKVGSGVSSAFGELVVDAVFGSFLNRIQKLILLVSGLVAESLEADAGSVWMIRKSSLHRAVIINRPVDLLDSFEMGIREGLAGDVARVMEPIVVNDVLRDPRTARKEYAQREGLVTYLGCPIMVNTRCIGVICMFRKRSQNFDQRDVSLAESFAGLLGLAIHHCSIAPSSFDQWQRLIKNMDTFRLPETLMTGRVGRSARVHPIWVLEDSLPKGIHAITLAKIRQFLVNSNEPITSVAIAHDMDLSVSTARRYLNYLADSEVLKREVEYSKVGRPSYSYRLSGDS